MVLRVCWAARLLGRARGPASAGPKNIVDVTLSSTKVSKSIDGQGKRAQQEHARVHTRKAGKRASTARHRHPPVQKVCAVLRPCGSPGPARMAAAQLARAVAPRPRACAPRHGRCTR